MANNKNISIIADGLAGDSKGNVLGYNNTPNGYIAPVIGKSERNSNASYIDKDGVMQIAPPNQLRVDYTNGVAEILLEPQSTNLEIYSEPTSGGTNVSFESFDWGVIGFTNCVKYDDNSVQRDYLNVQIVSGSTFTRSFYIIMDDLGEPIISSNVLDGDLTVYIGAVPIPSTNIEIKNIGNNIYKVVANSTSSVTNSQYSTIRKSTTQSNRGFRVVGLQLEPLSYPTSYIPTNGSTVTRLADNLTDFGVESLINSDEGMLVFEGSTLVDREGDRRFDISQDGQGANRLYLSFNTSTKGFAISCSRNGSTIFYSSFGDFFNPYDQTVNRKIIIQYSSSGVIVYFDGVEVFSNSIDSSLQNINKMEFKNISQNNFFGRVRQYRHLPYNTDRTTV